MEVLTRFCGDGCGAVLYRTDRPRLREKEGERGEDTTKMDCSPMALTEMREREKNKNGDPESTDSE
jgi:hypothetical protein